MLNFPRAAQSPRGRRRKRLSAPGRRTAAPSLSDIPRRLVGLGEPRLLVPVPARCDQLFAGDGGERSQNRIFTSPSFSDHGSALAGERVVVASRDRRQRTRRAERRGRSVAFSATGATRRRPGAENGFPRAKLPASGAKSPRPAAETVFPPRRRTGRRSASGIGKRNTRLVRVRVLRKFGGDQTSRPGEAAVKRGDPRSQEAGGRAVGGGGPGRSRGALRSRP